MCNAEGSSMVSSVTSVHVTLQIAARNSITLATEKEQDQECSIYASQIEEDQGAKLTKCGHDFHFDCISQWFQLSGSCPNCRDIPGLS